ncbi:unnamed protein product [Clonostachys byssicola]|uniref:Uncharacterized protein n=1 Tax=Clonostachys byssicola TaxID=160290 RepID=A0A9N9UD03_9HYPO|nr:unnamed protein product [Clonostachys byssicola]
MTQLIDTFDEWSKRFDMLKAILAMETISMREIRDMNALSLDQYAWSIYLTNPKGADYPKQQCEEIFRLAEAVIQFADDARTMVLVGEV